MADEREALQEKYGVNVRARLLPDELAQVDREAERDGRTRSQQIRHYVRAGLGTLRKGEG